MVVNAEPVRDESAVVSRFTTEALKIMDANPNKVFPCFGKIPAIPEAQGGHGVLDATRDIAKIEEWGRLYPNANVAMAFFEDTPTVAVEVDHNNFSWLDARQREHGPFETRTTRSGGLGFHFIYQRPPGVRIPNVSKKAGTGYEIKSDRTYLMAPGSIHPDPPHRVYELVSDIDPQPMPDWMIKEFTELFKVDAGANGNGNGHKKGKPPILTPIAENKGRNDACITEGGRLLRIYKNDMAVVIPMVRAYNQTICKPPLTDEELDDTVFKSLGKYATKALEAEDENSKDPLHRTDLGNMHRLIALHGDEFRWCEGPDVFMVWQGEYWKEASYLVVEMAKDVPKAIYAEAGKLTNDDERKKLVEWGMSTENRKNLTAMVELSKTDPRIHTYPSDYDQDKWLLNCKNGTVNLRTGELKPHDRADFITRISQHSYIPGLRSETWEKFLERILPDAATREFVRQAAGYSINGTQDEQIVLFCYGEGNNGKSTFLEAIRGVLGPYAHEVEPDVFMQRKYGRDSKSPDEEVGNLHRKRFLTATELEDDQTLAVTFLKRASGGEQLTCNMKYAHSFKFDPEFTLWMSGNHKPKVSDRTNSIWRRLRQIPFTVQIPPEERIKGFGEMLEYNYGDAILTWLVQASVDCFEAGGLVASEAVMKATEEYRLEEDEEWQFLTSDSAFIDRDRADVEVEVKKLYETYTLWWWQNINTKGGKPLGKKKFNQALRDRFHFTTAAKTDHKTFWEHIGVYTTESEPT